MRFAVLLTLFALGCSSSDAPPPPAGDASTDTKKADTAPADTSATDTATDTTSCSGGQKLCSGKCVDVTSDIAHCGECGKACLEKESCVGGSCQCSASFTKCGGTCVDTQSDNANCGTCGNSCPTGQTCSEGKCQAPCPTGETRCSGVCVNTKTDAKNCGACGTACPTGQSCADGKCDVICELPEKKCGGKCVNIGFDANNCGDCGKVCPSGPKGTAACTSSSCVVLCDTGYGNCDDDGKTGCEVELATNNSHCGACGNACKSTESCIGGKCECKSGATKCGTSCVDVKTDNGNCGTCGNACDCGAACAFGSGCNAGTCCASGTIACAGACVNPISDPKNCGGCGTTCSGSTPYCYAGKCQATCGGGLTACGGACTDTSSDPANCGVCGKTCSSGEVCLSGSCISNPFPGTTIVTSDQGKQINTWVGTPSQVWARCYSKTIDGGSSTTFHSKCDGKGPTVTLARLRYSTNTRVVGGYASLSWSTLSGYKSDPNAFLFSVTNNYKHTHTGSTTYSLYHNSSYGPTWGGGHDLYITGTMSGYYCYPYTYSCRPGYSGTTCMLDFCGSSTTSSTSNVVEELEVWYKP